MLQYILTEREVNGEKHISVLMNNKGKREIHILYTLFKLFLREVFQLTERNVCYIFNLFVLIVQCAVHYIRSAGEEVLLVIKTYLDSMMRYINFLVSYELLKLSTFLRSVFIFGQY